MEDVFFRVVRLKEVLEIDLLGSLDELRQDGDGERYTHAPLVALGREVGGSVDIAQQEKIDAGEEVRIELGVEDVADHRHALLAWHLVQIVLRRVNVLSRDDDERLLRLVDGDLTVVRLLLIQGRFVHVTLVSVDKSMGFKAGVLGHGLLLVLLVSERLELQ